MSLELSFSNPKVRAKFVFGMPLMPTLNLSSEDVDVDINQNDFCELILYFLTNTDLIGVEDPRFKLMMKLEKIKLCDGLNPGESKFEILE